MRQGRGGWDFTQEVWETGAVGIMFGGWAAEDVMGPDGNLDQTRLSLEWLREGCAHPTLWLEPRGFGQIRAFLVDIPVGGTVIVSYGDALHVGIVQAGLYTFPGLYDEERIKCRPVENARRFPLAELPSAFRLLLLTGQQTIQRIGACAPYAALLANHQNAAGVRHQLTHVTTETLLEMLTPEQWEVLCEEYLRDLLGYRSLLVARGRTLPGVDLVGVDQHGHRILAQCKNHPDQWDASAVTRWAETIGAPDDRRFFFNRGGFKGTARPGIELVDGAAVMAWLEAHPDYSQRLRVL
jgi:hypothetical protein